LNPFGDLNRTGGCSPSKYQKGEYISFVVCAFLFKCVQFVHGREGKRMTEVVTWGNLLQFTVAIISVINLVLTIVNFYQNNNKKK